MDNSDIDDCAFTIVEHVLIRDGETKSEIINRRETQNIESEKQIDAKRSSIED